MAKNVGSCRWVALLAWALFGCEPSLSEVAQTGEQRSIASDTSPSAATTTPSPDVPHDPPPGVESSAAPVDQKATAELPAKSFRIDAVLGKPKRQVDKVLGRGHQMDDGPWLYSAFARTAVVVVFEQGTAVYVSVEPPEYHGTYADRDAVLAWMHAPSGIDLDERGFQIDVGVWLEGAQARQRARRALAERLKSSLGTGYIVAANFTRLELLFPPADECSRELLRAMKENMDLDKAGFDSLECAGTGALVRL